MERVSNERRVNQHVREFNVDILLIVSLKASIVVFKVKFACLNYNVLKMHLILLSSNYNEHQILVTVSSNNL